MRSEERAVETLRRLASMPFLDRLELAAVSGWASGSAHGSLAALERRGFAQAVRHAAPLIASTRRWCVTASGLRSLAEADGVAMEELLREQPVSAHWQRALMRRLDAVGVVYRLASAVAAVAGPLSFRWCRTLALDAAIVFEDGRSVGVVRWGAMSDGTAFSKRMWRVLDGRASGVGGLLVIVPDGVRLRWARRLLARAFVPVRLVVERNVLVAGKDDAVWSGPSGGEPLTLGAALEGVRPRRPFPSEPALREPSPPDDLAAAAQGRGGSGPSAAVAAETCGQAPAGHARAVAVDHAVRSRRVDGGLGARGIEAGGTA